VSAGDDLRRLAENRQMPDANRLTITLGELRAALARPVPAAEPRPSVADVLGVGMLARVRLNGEPLTTAELSQLVDEAARLAVPAAEPRPTAQDLDEAAKTYVDDGDDEAVPAADEDRERLATLDDTHHPQIVDDYGGPIIECINQHCNASRYSWWTDHAALLAGVSYVDPINEYQRGYNAGVEAGLRAGVEAVAVPAATHHPGCYHHVNCPESLAEKVAREFE